jgi:hypothetical protein
LPVESPGGGESVRRSPDATVVSAFVVPAVVDLGVSMVRLVVWLEEVQQAGRLATELVVGR